MLLETNAPTHLPYRPPYDNTEQLHYVLEELATYPGLIDHEDVFKLRSLFKASHRKKHFILQAGDCAERFSDGTADITSKKCRQLHFLQHFIQEMFDIPVIPIGRIAGQYAKPRSALLEKYKDKQIYSYHGDIINHEDSCFERRKADPLRMLEAYKISKEILDVLANANKNIFTSHECFLVEYEKQLTREKEKRLYNLSTHFPWLGMRNLNSDEHIAYLSTIFNPVGVKVGPSVDGALLVEKIKQLNSKNEEGKIVLITRLGTQRIRDILPNIIDAITKSNMNVIWMCDPMHGNTQIDKYGKKFRSLQDAINETLETHRLLEQHRHFLSGIHLEISPRTDILECVSSTEELTENRVYDSAVDPRFNYHQVIFYLNQVIEKIKGDFY